MTDIVYFIHEDELLRDTIDRMLKRGFNNISVLDHEDKLVGLVNRASMVDIVYDTIWGDDSESNPLETTKPFNTDVENN